MPSDFNRLFGSLMTDSDRRDMLDRMAKKIAKLQDRDIRGWEAALLEAHSILIRVDLFTDPES